MSHLGSLPRSQANTFRFLKTCRLFSTRSTKKLPTQKEWETQKVNKTIAENDTPTNKETYGITRGTDGNDETEPNNNVSIPKRRRKIQRRQDGTNIETNEAKPITTRRQETNTLNFRQYSRRRRKGIPWARKEERRQTTGVRGKLWKIRNETLMRKTRVRMKRMTIVKNQKTQQTFDITKMNRKPMT